ncbi:hypothetical protein [Streptomyces sp. MH60]|uniref:hypothetical protein n=1 Tax=Streptomyces sp. MH60 TaxID=1940758 RepID=UPI000CEF594B|nr:hypothetical protein [Streptomyces sp. MH60]PPS89540.1 hypothetical protein BZZ08_01687 [Streptomyces sp. MH60]
MTAASECVGKIVSIERIDADYPSYPAYPEGEYLVSHATDSKFCGVRINRGHKHGGFTALALAGAAITQGVPLTGDDAYRIYRVRGVESWMAKSLDALSAEIAFNREDLRQQPPSDPSFWEMAAQRVLKLRTLLERAEITSDPGVKPSCAYPGCCRQPAQALEGQGRDELPVLDVYLPPGAAVHARPGYILRVHHDAAA